MHSLGNFGGSSLSTPSGSYGTPQNGGFPSGGFNQQQQQQQQPQNGFGAGFNQNNGYPAAGQPGQSGQSGQPGQSGIVHSPIFLSFPINPIKLENNLDHVIRRTESFHST